MEKLFIVLLMSASLSNADNSRYPHLSKLPQDSLLRTRCEDVPRSRFINSNIESACERLNKVLETGRLEAGFLQCQVYTTFYNDDLTEWLEEVNVKQPIKIILTDGKSSEDVLNLDMKKELAAFKAATKTLKE